jgi:hypothetical protein
MRGWYPSELKNLMDRSDTVFPTIKEIHLEELSGGRYSTKRIERISGSCLCTFQGNLTTLGDRDSIPMTISWREIGINSVTIHIVLRVIAQPVLLIIICPIELLMRRQYPIAIKLRRDTVQQSIRRIQNQHPAHTYQGEVMLKEGILIPCGKETVNRS